jgi:hypothetical protein
LIEVLLAVIFGAFSIYTFVYEQRCGLTLEILSNTSVLDIHEEVGNLTILYDGMDIIQRRETLRIITLRFLNDGQLDILKNFYDENDPVGFTLAGGKIVKTPELLDASNEYLQMMAKSTLVDPQKVLVEPVILESGEYFVIKMLVLCPEDTLPTVTPMGKIAGVKRIGLTERYLEKNKEPFWVSAFSGNAVVQLTRTLSYFIAGLLLLIIAVILVAAINDGVEKARRNSLVRGYLKDALIAQPSEDLNMLFRQFVKSGNRVLLITDELASNETLRNTVFQALEDGPIEDLDIVFATGKWPAKGEYRGGYPPDRGNTLLQQIRNTGFIVRKDSDYVVNEKTARILTEFIEFLRNRNVIELDERAMISSRRLLFHRARYSRKSPESS